MDVIFLRNVLIHFDLETKRFVLNQIQNTLHADGYLFLGCGEITLLDVQSEAIQAGIDFYHRLRSA